MVKTFKIEGSLGYWGLYTLIERKHILQMPTQIDKPTPQSAVLMESKIVQGTVPAIIAIAGLFSPSEFVLTRLRLSFTVGRLRGRWKRWALSGCGAGDIISTSPPWEIITKSSPYFYGIPSIPEMAGLWCCLPHLFLLHSWSEVIYPLVN